MIEDQPILAMLFIATAKLGYRILFDYRVIFMGIIK